jgi:predicted deacylase
VVNAKQEYRSASACRPGTPTVVVGHEAARGRYIMISSGLTGGELTGQGWTR